MRKTILIAIFLFTAILCSGEVAAICCEDPGTSQCKCWSSGYCCYKSNNLQCATICNGNCYWSSTSCVSTECSGSLSVSVSGTGTCTVTASLTASNCNGKSWQIKTDGTTKCSGTVSGSPYSYTCPGWTVAAGTYTYNLYIDGVKKDSKPVTCNPLICNNNRLCESGETQANCPNDCKTIVTVFPPSMYPGDRVSVTVYFNDSSYTSGRNAKIALYIDNIPWTNCSVHDSKWNDMGWTGTSNWIKNDVEITSLNSYGKIKFDCTVPTNLAQGTHKLKAVPSMYSEETKLNGGEAEFSVLNSFVKFLKSVFASIKQIF